ncbi:hypothetical protein [Amycolatopsis keratiniphila]|uniref:Uncharacterized protein n=1 Tax=Amycolatopsis keratiniphila TaxID=129921 RepID=R4SX41_9PSEU|nr:hypothetical protein [Amycolatopsis keratiniphila]AGM07105.1 hypothetical protein AORI_4521 [Amycolatopsis keratiniphila]
MLSVLVHQVTVQNTGVKPTEIATVVVAFFALTAATWSALTAHRTGVRQAQQLQEARDHEIRRQAAQVAAWSVPNMDNDGTQTISTYIVNASSLPVFTLELTDVGGTWNFAVQEPTPEPRLMRAQDYDWSEDGIDPSEIRMATLLFTDAEGNRWVRDKHGLWLLERAKLQQVGGRSVGTAAAQRSASWWRRGRQSSAANDQTG